MCYYSQSVVRYSCGCGYTTPKELNRCVTIMVTVVVQIGPLLLLKAIHWIMLVVNTVDGMLPLENKLGVMHGVWYLSVDYFLAILKVTKQFDLSNSVGISC